MPINYVDDIMNDASASGLDDDLRQLAEDDVKLLKNLNVSDERERNLIFYLDLFLDELCDDVGLCVPTDRMSVLTKAFEELRGAKDVGLVEIRSALYRALGGKRTKVAYPNIMGVMETNAKPQRDMAKWVKTLGDIHAAERIGADRNHALRNFTEEWDPVEKLDFQQWLNYYEHGDHEKYAAPFQTGIPQEVPVQPVVTQRQQPEIQSVEQNRKSLVSRLDSAKRLLRLFAPPVWPRERWDSIYRALSDLEQEIISLRTASSMRDRIIRTANIWDRAGFSDGADTLRKIAQSSGEDVTSQIEKALTGREYETKKPTGDLPPTGMEGMPMPPTDAVPPEGAPVPEGMPPAAVEPLPEPPPPPLPSEPEPELKTKPSENPYEGSTTKDILNVLEPLLKKFKERETVRQLSKIDMMMHSLGIVSYFPELGEAIGRLLETDSYVGGRLERITGKLQGGIRDISEKNEKDKDKEGKPPTVDMGAPEETAVTVGETPPKLPEETAVTVGEQPTMAPATPPTTPPSIG